MTELQFEAFVNENTPFVWKRALLLSEGDMKLAEEHATMMFIDIWNQMAQGTYKSVVVSVMSYMRRELVGK